MVNGKSDKSDSDSSGSECDSDLDIDEDVANPKIIDNGTELQKHEEDEDTSDSDSDDDCDYVPDSDDDGESSDVNEAHMPAKRRLRSNSNEVFKTCERPRMQTSTSSKRTKKNMRKEVLDLIQDAIQSSLEDENVKVCGGKSNKNKKKKRSRSPPKESKVNKKRKAQQKLRRRASIPNTLLPPPPIFPTDLKSLIELAERCKDRVYADTQRLYPLLGPLKELNSLVGLVQLKQQVTDFVINKLQKKPKSEKKDALHHVLLFGPPGVGKTTFLGILSSILTGLGTITSNKVVFGTPSSMIGRFLGSTAPMTESVIRSSFGGVLAIDEASAFSDGRSADSGNSFSKSCLDTLNRMLTEHGSKFVCVLAGYKSDIIRDVLSVNPGLKRRFTTVFEFDGYTPDQMCQLTTRCITDSGLTVDPKLISGLQKTLFEEEEKSAFSSDTSLGTQVKHHFKYFKNFGGDARVFSQKVTEVYYATAFGKSKDYIVNKSVILQALKKFKKMQKGKLDAAEESKRNSAPPFAMYT